ncbi:hypothetical protein SAMN05660350_04136 [Geodermatophilus obscurus]|uniref:Uncharacterized protein n=1 Tax=Geodermatophilus obscurus TaxID=1861 RepID=A0A1M7UWK5_9ACTN|nr:hypothetical protein [Geodermatophilus obscurus]SHN87363.1 hypothetical protein SAMN05660350_04136 [Geodermatophilus obscurus]
MATSTSADRILWLRTRPAVPAEPDLPADVAVQVAAVALADHPGAVVDRIEVDPTGWCTVHLVTRAGVRVVVHVDRDLTVLGWLALAR